MAIDCAIFPDQIRNTEIWRRTKVQDVLRTVLSGVGHVVWLDVVMAAGVKPRHRGGQGPASKEWQRWRNPARPITKGLETSSTENFGRSEGWSIFSSGWHEAEMMMKMNTFVIGTLCLYVKHEGVRFVELVVKLNTLYEFTMPYFGNIQKNKSFFIQTFARLSSS